MARRILVTSALPYANGPLHLGHMAGAYLPADIYVRYQRLRRQDVVFICGSDEHGVPITIMAEKEGVSPQVIVDRYHAMNERDFQRFGISFDNYSRTTLPLHHQTSQEFFLALYRKGLLVERTVKQLYCPRCRRFLADRYVEGECPHCHAPGARGDQCENCGKWIDPLELVEPRCKLCGTRPVVAETRHFFLPLGRFQEQLRRWLDTKTTWKDNVRNFCYGWLNEGLQDRAVTRDLSWGVRVPVPGYEDKVLYVWFDAPIGYISSTKEWALKRGEPELWREYWQREDTELVHFIGKDNIVFHAIVWPAILMGVGGYVLPSEIPANEFLNLEGRKLSTSRNYAVWLGEYLDRFPPDPLRYCLAVNAPETKDSDFSWKDFQARNNNELADILGNFVHRSLTFVQRFFEGKVPPRGELNDADRQMLETLREAPRRIGSCLERFEVRRAIREYMDVARECNRYFDSQEPWRTAREDRARCATTLSICAQAVRTLAVTGYPFLPFSAEKMWGMLQEEVPLAAQVWDEAGEVPVPGNRTLGKVEILFAKIADEEIEPEIDKLEQAAAALEEESREKTIVQIDLPAGKEITYDEFARMDLRVARVKQAERVPNTDKLLRLVVDLGSEERQIVAGIAEHYRPEDLVGRLVVVVANLAPRKLRGLESRGMLLAAEDAQGKLSLVTLDRDIAAGSKVK
ncbi:MAG: methionine--tRNA ligase [candidate division KSB1 bacterium]|nr:methionine--tRNA ligase [candidate division KSB1 bacterium]